VEWVCRQLRSSDVEVVMVEYIDIWIPFLDALAREGIRVFGHAHGYDISERLRSPWWAGQYFKYNDTGGVITMSERSADRLAAAGVRRDRIFIVPYGVDIPDRPPPRPQREAVNCLAVGRMVPKKGPLVTIQAFAAARREVPSLRLTVIGTGSLLEPAVQMTHDLEIQDHVRFLGSRPERDVLEHLRLADVFLQHSMVDPKSGDEEGLPIIILQAMAAGLPVLSTRHAGIPDAVDDGRTGLLVDEGDVGAMTKRLVELAQSPGQRATMGDLGWERALDRFSWRRERSELLEILGLSGGPKEASTGL
jgi:glycosyltransferase involved in cell wall biosynthesis